MGGESSAWLATLGLCPETSPAPGDRAGFQPRAQNCYGGGVSDTDPQNTRSAVYGAPPFDLVDVPDGAVQVSPLRPGAAALEGLPDCGLDRLVVAAPPGSIERRFVLAHGLRALRPGGALTVLAPKDKGGQRLRGELEGFGCAVSERSKARQRICHAERPDALEGIEDAIAAGAPSMVEETGLHSQPGVFSWNRLDPGTALLQRHLPAFSGDGADLGAGLGILARSVLALPGVRTLTLVEIDRRAVEASRANVLDPRARFLWADVRSAELTDLDFVVSNPPFHAEGIEDRALGQAFITAAARMLRRSGTLVLVANRHMPYEDTLRSAFRSMTVLADEAGYKIIEARK